MFTGIIKDIGIIKNIRSSGDGLEIEIRSEKICSDAKPDDSVAVNGVCLTITKTDGSFFTVQSVRESISRTNIGLLKKGDYVNLEPALRPSDRLGGHIVQGHIDGKGEVIRTVANKMGREFWISADPDVMKYIVAKGSVCLDGVSLTVAEKKPGSFRVAVIPHTEKNTTVREWNNSRNINIETDIIGRYIENFLKTDDSGLTIEKLTELGY
ncbi:MAG TPA: riboflavin synthase [Clostridiales bacterium]|nr:riboflavin synthase [Clostridiales bacterium]HQP69746.1 riboflavin synthase [Clostridiales bacterium]